MNKVLLKELRKESKVTQFFGEWRDLEYHKELELKIQNIGMREGLTIACFDYGNLSLAKTVDTHRKIFLKSLKQEMLAKCLKNYLYSRVDISLKINDKGFF